MGRYSSEHIPPGAYISELVVNSPEVWLNFNAAGDLIQIEKHTSAGAVYIRDIRDPDVADYDIARTAVYSRWKKK